MAYAVRIMPRAERDFAAIFETINAQHSDAAVRWFNGLRRAVLTLENNPARCPVTPENKRMRHLLYGRRPHVYRVIYRILERRGDVQILHIRHGARDKLERVISVGQAFSLGGLPVSGAFSPASVTV